MIRANAMRVAALSMAILVAACGGGKGGAGASGQAQAKADLSAMDQLKGLSADLQGRLDALMAPINEVDYMVSYLADMPARLGVDARSLLASARSTMDTGQISLSADLTSDAAVRAEIENVLARLRWIVGGLLAIPDNAKALATKAGQALVELPVLATRVTAEANVKIANPFAKPEAKAQAQADIQSLAQVQASVQKQIQDVQAKIMGLPALGTKALAKLTASFARGAHGKGSTKKG